MEDSTFLEKGVTPIIKTYKRRWIILTIYIIYGTLSSAQWVQYSIITNLMVKYYNVSVITVDWTSMVFMIMWPILVLPGCFMIDKMGLRISALLGATLTALGTVVKLFSVPPESFYVLMIGQTITATSQIFILSLPQKIAATWFPPAEVSTVCALGMFALGLGTALSFIVPPLVVRDHDILEDIGADMNVLNWGLAGLCLPIALAVFFYFPKRPPHAPSLPEHHARETKREITMHDFGKSVIELIKNRCCMLHSVSFSCTFAIYSVFSTLLNQIVLSYFEDAQKHAGLMGLVMVCVGMGGTVTVGIILDKTRKFKTTAILVSLLCAVSLGGFLLSLEMKSLWMSYATISIFGLFLNAYIPVGMEVAIELTYPLPETTVTSMLLAFSQLIAVALTMLFGEIGMRFGAFYCVLGQGAILLLGTLTTIATPNRMKRQEAYKLADDCKYGQFEMDKKSFS